MKAFRNRMLPLVMVAGLAVLGVACEDEGADGGVEDPAIEEDGTGEEPLEEDGAGEEPLEEDGAGEEGAEEDL